MNSAARWNQKQNAQNCKSKPDKVSDGMTDNKRSDSLGNHCRNQLAHCRQWNEANSKEQNPNRMSGIAHNA